MVEINANLLSPVTLFVSRRMPDFVFFLSITNVSLAIFSIGSKVSDLDWSRQTLPEMLQFTITVLWKLTSVG